MDNTFVGCLTVNLAKAHFLYVIVHLVSFVCQRCERDNTFSIRLYRFIIQM